MDQAKHYYRLGLFVVVALTIIAAALFVLGGRKLLQPSFTFETYFDGAVTGLETGSPVRYRGVPLGEVSAIVMSASEYESNTPIPHRRDYIVVRAKINASSAQVNEIRKDAAELIGHGLRAQLQMESIAGQPFLALDIMDPGKYPALPFPWSPKYPYLPSAPSLTGQIIGNVQQFLASLNQADIKSLARNVNSLVLTINDKLGQVPVTTITQELKNVLQSANTTIEHLNAAVTDPGIKQSVDNVTVTTARLRQLTEKGELDRTVNQLDEAAARLNGLVGDNAYDIRGIVEDLRATAQNLRTLSGTVSRYPAGALIGGPPGKVRLPKEHPP